MWICSQNLLKHHKETNIPNMRWAIPIILLFVLRSFRRWQRHLSQSFWSRIGWRMENSRNYFLEYLNKYSPAMPILSSVSSLQTLQQLSFTSRNVCGELISKYQTYLQILSFKFAYACSCHWNICIFIQIKRWENTTQLVHPDKTDEPKVQC